MDKWYHADQLGRELQKEMRGNIDQSEQLNPKQLPDQKCQQRGQKEVQQKGQQEHQSEAEEQQSPLYESELSTPPIELGLPRQTKMSSPFFSGNFPCFYG